MSVQIAKADSGWPVWGHDHAVRELQSAIRRGVRHAYILSGYHHVGKASLAMEFARALLCATPPEPGIPCGECRSCRLIARGSHPDVTLYDLDRQQQTGDKASTGKNLSLTIQTVREISSNVSLRPMEANHRVIVVDDVETMQETAQEAFLKTLEEPPPYAVILLLTTDAEMLLETIRSRAATIQLQTVPSATILTMLEASGIEPEKARTVAAASVGRPGWAVRALEDDKLFTEQVEVRSSAESWVQGDRYQRLVEATRLGDMFSKDRETVYARVLAAQTVWRSILLQSAGVGDADAGMVDVAFAPVDAVRALKSVNSCLSDLDANVRPRLALQSMVLQWPNP